MSFYGTSMIFDGIACEEMGLTLYSFDNHKQDETAFSSDLKISEDRIDGRFRSLFYGGTINEPLEFTLTLCASDERVANKESFDRWDLQKIASWLTGHAEYKWLTIVQPDMEDVRYRCICSELVAVEVADKKWGFSCKVTCDSPYAYTLPRSYVFDFSGTGSLAPVAGGGDVFSESSANDFYYPVLKISHHNGGDLAIMTQNSRETSVFKFYGVPASCGTITIDCENGVITADDGSNLYKYLNFSDGFHFPRFARGNNHLQFGGTGIFTFVCEWPVNVGG